MSFPPERFVDQIEAEIIADEWLEPMANEAYSRRPDVEIQRYGLAFPMEPSAMPSGGVLVFILWIGCRPRAIATLLRDDANFTILCRVEYPEAQQHCEQE